MFFLAFVIVTALAAIPLVSTWRKWQKSRNTEEEVTLVQWCVSAGILVGALVAQLIAASVLGIYGEALWFDHLGQAARYWKVFGLKIGLGGAAFVLASLVAYVNLKYSNKHTHKLPLLPGLLAIVMGVVASFAGAALWESWLLYTNQVAGTVTDPIFGLNESFYLFSLPLYNEMYYLSLLFVAIMMGSVFVYLVTSLEDYSINRRHREEDEDPLSGSVPALIRQLVFWAAVACFVFVWGNYLDRFDLMYSTSGVVNGMGYTDLNARLPICNIMMVVWSLAGLVFLAIALVKPVFRKVASYPKWSLISLGVFVVLVALTIHVPPFFTQAFKVKPREITAESEFIGHNKQMTRAAYGLEKANVEEREFPVASDLTASTMEDNRATLDNVRLWDPRALHAVLTQTQEIRHYYEFADVDIDRYPINGEMRQVMVSAREMAINQLPAQAQTWINKHFKYTHGHGMTVNPVNTFLHNGGPELWVRDIPAQSDVPELALTRPEIYFGEMTNHHIYVNTKEKEFDYPSGDQNNWSMYEGTAGIELSGFLRKFAYAWMFDSHKVFLSDYLTPESRIVFNRNIADRMELLAPFLDYDPDPYPVVYNGGIVWIQDAYTTSSKYPYSERYEGINYIRNSVKATVDAYNGIVTFYVFDESDPIIQTYRNAFPKLFRPASEMPPELRQHVRYPEKMFKIQHTVFRKYHIDDIQNFYNQEDMWDLATELYRGNSIPVEPYFVIAQLPGAEAPEFMLMSPYTAKGKPRMTGWMSGLCDQDNYGKLVLYKFPKGEFIAGPQQIESKIDSHEKISQQLTLWDQKGSEVIRGNLIILPMIGNKIIGFEPVYLQAETAKIPTLVRIVAVQILPGDQKIVWDESFKDVLRVLLRFGGDLKGPGVRAELEKVLSSEDLVDVALESLIRYQELSGEGKFGEAGAVLEELRLILEKH